MENTDIFDLQRSFTPRDLFKSFNPDFFDMEYCRRWVLDRIHPDGPRCPSCSGDLTPVSEKSFYDGRKVVCRHCKKRFTAMTGTFLSGTHLTYKEIVLVLLLFHLRVETTEIMKHASLSRDTLNIYRRKFATLQDMYDYS